MGVVLQANHASVGSLGAMNGGSVFDGDALSTDTGGTLQVRFGGSQAYLLPRSMAVVHQAKAGFGATLNSGSLIVASEKGNSFTLLADGATIRPATSGATVGQVTLVSPTELLLSSEKGSLEVSMDDDVKTLPEGKSVRMLIQPPDPGSPQTRRAGRNRFLWIFLAAVGAGVGIALWQALESPHKP